MQCFKQDREKNPKNERGKWTVYSYIHIIVFIVYSVSKWGIRVN